jgi:hypothetical protein
VLFGAGSANLRQKKPRYAVVATQNYKHKENARVLRSEAVSVIRMLALISAVSSLRFRSRADLELELVCPRKITALTCNALNSD